MRYSVISGDLGRRVSACCSVGAIILGLVTPIVSPAGEDNAALALPPQHLVDAIVAAWRHTGGCVGAVFNSPDLMNVESSAVNVRDATAAVVVPALIRNQGTLVSRTINGCTVVEPSTGKPAYLRLRLPPVSLDRNPLEVLSVRLREYMQVRQDQISHRAESTEGVVGSIGVSAGFAAVGPIELNDKTVEEALCRVASAIKDALWIAVPQVDNRVPWYFIRYSESDMAVKLKVQAAIQQLQEAQSPSKRR